MDVDFERYSRDAVHFFNRRVSPLLCEAVRQSPDDAVVVDYGCGDGAVIWSLRENGHLSRAGRVVGLDISPIRLKRFMKMTGCEAVRHDAAGVLPLAAQSADLLISTMVIEHVPNDHDMMRQIARVLKPGGRCFISTVLKKRWAWYFRRSPDGRWVLDATHVREYKSPQQVQQLVQQAGLRVERTRIYKLAFPIMHPVLRVLHRMKLVREVNRLFVQHRWLRWLEHVAVPVPGYAAIEVVAVKG